ncbi:MAG: metallophosphoesterase [Candidatus Hydrogenedentes bacterium]|nr:metallophosphoesterase [Candidatus Hydrogenedentota bacterium]
MTNRICCAVLIMTGVLYAEPARTVADRAFEMLRKDPPVSPDVFDFAVVADTRSLKVDQQSETFKQLIHDFNALKPAFIVDVGDIILGGSADLVPAQWDEFDRVTADLQVPLFPATGNHDVFDEATEKVWTERVGPLTYAFTYGNSRFVILNAEENNVVDRISESQLAWLKDELESHSAQHVFVFIHQPYFARDWDRQWAMVHDVLVKHPVRMVFGGDNHIYRYVGDRDGIHYVISAGGGAEVRVPEDEGGFHHFVLVRVRGDRFDWSVVKPGSILPKDVVTQARIDEIKFARNEWIRTEMVEVPVGEPFDRSVSVAVQAPGDGEIAWTVPAGWHVQPASMKYAIAAPASGITSSPLATFEFDIKADDAAAVKYPVPEFTTTYSNAKHGAAIEVKGRLNLVPSYTVRRAPGPIAVDGDLAEWSNVASIPLPYGWAFDVNDTADHQTSIQLAYDAENLYLAAVVKDDEFHQPYAGDIVWSADNLQLFFRMEDRANAPRVYKHYWEWGLTLTNAGPEVFMYHGVNRESIVVNAAVKLAVKRAGELTHYEAAFPKSEVAPLELSPGATFLFSIASNDLDPSHADRTRHWSELTPGVGDAVPGAPLAKVTLAE